MDSRVAQVIIGIVVTGIVMVIAVQYYQEKNGIGIEHTYTLPPLPYVYDALEPYIDARTMKIHHTKHHQGYVNKLNNALRNYPELRTKSLTYLLTHLNEVPQEIRQAVRNNGGGHANHSFFWLVMTPKSTQEPLGKIKQRIEKQFGSFAEFKKQFDAAALKVFGSGWVWLVLDAQDTLKIITTPNQESPISQGLVPLLALDVWEHAYYLKYQNRRADYTDAWWHVVDWKRVEKNYEQTQSSPDYKEG